MSAYMVKFLYRGPELIAEILPVCGLDINLQLPQCQPIIDTIRKQPLGDVLVIIVNGNSINQSFFYKNENN